MKLCTFGMQAAVGLALLTCLCLTIQEAKSAKILAVSIFATKSHKITYERLLIELAKRGHEVTYAGPIPSGKNITNLREILTFSEDAFQKDMPNMFEMKMSPLIKILGPFFNPFLLMADKQSQFCAKFYKLPLVKELLSEKYDLVFLTPLFNECLSGLAHKLNTTTVLYTTTQVFPWIAGNLGSPTPPSFVPSLLAGFSEEMSYFERIINMLGMWYVDLSLKFYYYPKLEAIYRELLDPSIPSITEIIKNTSIVLANADVSFDKPRPQMPDIIDVGGMHMIPAKPVPKDLDDFFSGAGEHGFIFFSMGSALKGSSMPDSLRQVFVNVFAKLKQRVLWKWETEEMEGLPPNVKLSKWLPQNDVLADKRIRLFITHGGHGGISESIYHGVPLVGIPMLADQPGNIVKAAKAGFSYSPLDIADLTEESLTTAINTVLNDPSYGATAKRLQKIFLDQMETPLERAIYWIEYVIRHQGATHLRSAARDLNFIQYFSIDVLLTFLVAILITLLVNALILRAIFRKRFGKKSKVVKSSKKKQ